MGETHNTYMGHANWATECKMLTGNTHCCQLIICDKLWTCSVFLKLSTARIRNSIGISAFFSESSFCHDYREEKNPRKQSTSHMLCSQKGN